MAKFASIGGWLSLAALSTTLGAATGQAQPVATSTAGPTPIATVRQGRLEGKAVGEGISVFLGVPFAAPPVGELRWRLPQPPAAWQGVRQAKSYGAACQQNDPSFGGIFDRSSREDCLYLNVWTPSLKPKKPLPVLIYIHGGALVGGAGSIPTFDGVEFGRKGVILVTINYRLGIFGFFSHPGLTAESRQNASGNYGIADQIEALRWVRQNIAAFGGDPSRVTISGQSAGSASVLMLMASPRAKGLFRGAIAESGTTLFSRWADRREAEALGNEFAISLGAKSPAELRAMTPAQLMTPWRKFQATKGSSLMRLTVDGWIFDRSASDVFAAHGEAAVPLLTGNNAREGLGAPAAADFPSVLAKSFGTQADRSRSIYVDGPADPVLGTPTDRFATDTTFRCPAVVVAGWHAKQGSPTFAYQFEEPLPTHKSMGSQHSDEVPFVFSTLRMMMFGAPVPAQDRALSETVSTYWANFTRRGDPNGSGLPTWPRYTGRGGEFVHVSATGVVADNHLQRDACNMYKSAVLPGLLGKQGRPR